MDHAALTPETFWLINRHASASISLCQCSSCSDLPDMRRAWQRCVGFCVGGGGGRIVVADLDLVDGSFHRGERAIR